MSDPIMNEVAGVQPFACCGCGKALDLGEYRSCDCATNVASRGTGSTFETVWKKNRCHWCEAIPIRANLDGDDLCQACCNKWVRAEGFEVAEAAALSKAQPRTQDDGR